jgi:hypothetical protein
MAWKGNWGQQGQQRLGERMSESEKGIILESEGNPPSCPISPHVIPITVYLAAYPICPIYLNPDSALYSPIPIASMAQSQLPHTTNLYAPIRIFRVFPRPG